MPAGAPPHKPIARRPRRGAARLRCAGCCVRGADGLSVCALEIERGGPSYTVDTLRELHAAPSAGRADVHRRARTSRSTLPSWHEPRELLELADARRRGARGQRPRAACCDALAPLGDGRRACASSTRRCSTCPPRVRASARRAGEPIERARRRGAWPSYIAEHGAVRAGAGGEPELMERSGAAASEIARSRPTRRRSTIVELDLRGVLGYTDYFLICSGNTTRQTKAIHDGILEGLKREHGDASAPRRGREPRATGS